MKTAREWGKEYTARFIRLDKEAEERVGEGVVPFEDIHEIIISEIQLDAMKEGMRRAAEIAGASGGIQTAKGTKQAILTAAEQLTEKDL